MTPMSAEEREFLVREKLASARAIANERLSDQQFAALWEMSERFLAECDRVASLSGQEFCQAAGAAIRRHGIALQAELERGLRERFEAARCTAINNAKVTQLREPAERFLAQYESIAVLTGDAFERFATSAIERFADETDAVADLALERLRDEYRAKFDEVCAVSASLLKWLEENYGETAKSGQARDLSSTWRLFREQATVFPAEADRIRALAGADFERQAGEAYAEFTTTGDTDTLLAELSADVVAQSFLQRLRVALARLGRHPGSR
jgi:hypothetical protein